MFRVKPSHPCTGINRHLQPPTGVLTEQKWHSCYDTLGSDRIGGRSTGRLMMHTMKVLVGGLVVLSFSPPAAVDAQAVCGHSEAVFLALALAHTAAASPPGGASTITQLSR